MTHSTVRRSLMLSAALLTAGVLTSLAAAPARAQTTVFTDRTAFNAATSNRTNIDFEGLVPANNGYASPNPLTLSGTTFTSNRDLYVVGPSYEPSRFGLGSGADLSFEYGNPNRLTVALPTGVTAFGLDFGSYFGGTTFTFALSTGGTFTAVAPLAGPSNQAYTGPGFVGFTSMTPLTSLTITTNSSDGQIDNVTFGTAATASAVPEPSEYAVGGMFGATLLFGMVKARRKAGSKKV